MSTKASRGFGSFQSPDVEVLISLPDSQYEPPRAAAAAELDEDLKKEILDGKLLLGEGCRKLFMIDFDKWTFLNHGAFGAPLKPVYDKAQEWRDACEVQPLKFLDRELLPLLAYVIREMAAYVCCSRQNLVLVPNATAGINAVMNNVAVDLGPGDVVYMLSIGYGATKKIVESVCQRTGASMLIHGIDHIPSGPDEIVDIVESSLPENTKLAIFDVVTSNTAMMLPVHALVLVCKARGIQVLLDGAHTLGMLPMDVEYLGADYFVANCHKWFSSVRGAAILYVDRNRDYSPYLSLLSAIGFWGLYGCSEHWGYIDDLLAKGVELLVNEWGTESLVPESLSFRSMALVKLKDGIFNALSLSEAAERIQDSLFHDHQVEVPIKVLWGKLYVRVSVFIYNTLEDFWKLAHAVSAIQEQQ